MQPDKKARRALLALFCLGGTSGLIYEVTWERQLSLAFGVSVYAASAVLAALMAGFALGSFLFGRVASNEVQEREPAFALRLYALLAAGTGLCAVMAIFILPRTPMLYVWIYRYFNPGFAALNLIRFGLAILILIVPSTLMGGTLPVLSQIVGHQERTRGREVGRLYAVNTLGGVIGALAAGLFLIRWWGVAATLSIAAGVDLAVAGAAFYLSGKPDFLAGVRQSAGRIVEGARPTRKSKQPTSPYAVSPRQVRLVFWGVALGGFAALGYEVLWTRILAIFSVSAVFSFTIMLVSFLAGIAAGGGVATRMVDRQDNPVRLYGYLQVGIGLSAILILYVFARLPSIIETLMIADTFGKLVAVEFFAAFVTMFVPAALMGAAFPFAVRVYAGGREKVGLQVGKLYAMNSLGSCLGPLLAGFLLIPLLGLQRASLALAFINIVLGIAILLTLVPAPRPQIAGALGLAIVGVAFVPQGIYLGFREGPSPYLLYYEEGIDATVAVFEVPDPPLKISFVNGRNEVPTDRYSMQAFHLLGHLPALLNPGAESALMIGFGNGITTGSLAEHGVPHIQAVELVAEQVKAAAYYEDENHGVLAYPGLDVTIEDGRNFLLRGGQTYDIITADATHPINTSSWALFTQEFYLLTRQRLAPGGVMVQWLPFHDLSEKDFRDIVRTFQSVYPHTSVWYTGGTHSFLVGTPDTITQDEVSRLYEQVAALGLEDELGDQGQFTGYFLMDEEEVADYVQGGQIITDNTAYFLPSRDMALILDTFVPYLE